MTRTDAELLIASRDDRRAVRELDDRWTAGDPPAGELDEGCAVISASA